MLRANVRKDGRVRDGLAKKLRLQRGQRAAILNAPEGYARDLDPPAGTTIVPRARGTCDFVQVFATSQSELETLAPRVLKILKPDGLLWLTYPKSSSRLATDLSRDRGWGALDRAGLRPVSQIAVDKTWSALRFRPKERVWGGGGPKLRA